LQIDRDLLLIETSTTDELFMDPYIDNYK